jgi:hypothetical protein
MGSTFKRAQRQEQDGSRFQKRKCANLKGSSSTLTTIRASLIASAFENASHKLDSKSNCFEGSLKKGRIPLNR